MTVQFSDIRNFTAITEKMTPKESFSFLNEFLGCVGPVVRRHNGFIDKYIGDAIMALYDESVDDALSASIEMQEEVEHFNARRSRSGLAPVAIGVGIHRGPVTLGVLGEAGRLESTVVGDTVNLASRLESLTKQYHALVLISRPTFEQQQHPEGYRTRPVDLVRVKGKRQAVELLEILDPRIDPSPILSRTEGRGAVRLI
jgi:two-component system sensor histidine kinase ChiS